MNFYFFHFIPFLIHILIFYFLGVTSWYISLFILGYSWNLLFLTPGLEERVLSKKYKYSFIRLCYLVNQFISRRLRVENRPIMGILGRSLGPFFLAFIFVILLGIKSHNLFILWGSMVCEVLNFFWKNLLTRPQGRP